jgi:TolB-like protein
MAASGAVYYFRQSAQQSDAAHTRSIAVLPFRLIGGEVDKDKLGLGMADAVITQLSKDPQLEVRPTSAIFRYVEAPDGDSIELGRQLGVDVVLEGTIQREGDQVKVSVQLLQMPEGNSLLAESFYEKASDIFVVQDLISKRIVTALSLRLTPQQESFLSDRGQRKADPQFGPLFPK